MFRDPQGLLETLGLVPLADIPAGRVVHSLAACLVSEDVEDFTRRFHGLFEEEGRHGRQHPRSTIDAAPQFYAVRQFQLTAKWL